MNYAEISKETFDLLYQSRTSLNRSPLPAAIRVLAELRVSQINACAYCCRLHTDEARKLGIPQEKLDVLPGWNHSTAFSQEEEAALFWVEAVTYLNHEMKQAKDQLSSIFSEKQIVDLTACIAIMNALNRVVISLR